MKFTETSVKAIPVPADAGDYIVWDEDMPSFGIRFQKGAQSKGTFIVQYRVGTRQRRQSLGRVGKVSLKDAKATALQYFAQVGQKIDPAIERAKAAAKASQSMQPLIQPFLSFLEVDKKRSKSYVAENKRSLERYFKALHQFSPEDIDRATISRELATIKMGHGPIAMNRARSHLSKFFMWMLGEGYVESNPVSGTNKNEEGVRRRVLNEKELVSIWNAASSGSHFDTIVRLLMLTAARRDQIGQLRRAEIDFDKGLIQFGADRMKNGIEFVLPLSNQAKAILKEVKERDKSAFVFGEGQGGFSGWSKCKERFDEDKCPVHDWVFHDFRRTFDTLSQDRLKIAPHISDLLLSHKGEVKKGVRKHYNFAEYLEEKTDAMKKWGDFIEGLVTKSLKQAA